MTTNTVTTRNRRKRRNNRPPNKGDAVGEFASDAWSLAKRTAYGLNEIRKLINIETKYLDTNNSQTPNRTGSIAAVTQVAQGLTSTTRVGDSIRLQRIEMRGTVACNALDASATVRVILVRDLDQNGVIPATSDILELVGSSVSVHSPEKFNQRERFSILFDETFTVQSTAQGVTTIPFSYTSTHGGHVLYLGTTAAAASNGKGSVYFMSISDETTNLPQVDYYTRFLYTDD